MAHLLRSADAAMYFAKQSGKQGYRIFTQGLADANTRRIQVETALKGAIGKPEFSVVYQPQLSIEANRIVGFEALARWKHPRLDDVSPSEFIPIAENSGLIGRLGEWVLETACMDAKHIFTAAGRAMRLAVNLSPKQLEREGFLESLQAILARTGFPAHQLEIEITEGLLISDSGTVWSNLRGLQGLGVQTAIDDFGTGFSNISYLLKLQVNRIKIDRSFIANLETDSGADAVVGALIGMAGSLGVGVVAEGVETEGQLRLLREKSCDEAQGYLLYRPMSVARLCEVVGDETGGLPEEGHPVSPPARAGKEADSLRE
jgi:EAL domain-containing protein (putative c-di-GMP-specific phosphodiesterase class I)